MTRPEQLIDSTHEFLEQQVIALQQQGLLEGRYRISVNRLDPRLRLPLCDNPLTHVLESPSQPLGRVSVRVRCEGASPWQVFVSGQVQVYRQVLVTLRPLKRLAAIAQADLGQAERDIGSLSQGYLTDLSQVEGKRVKRAVMSGQVLSPNLLELSDVVAKGDQVVINANSAGVSIRMQGEALSRGAPGEQISVRNLQSQRVIRARVIGPGQVEVEL